jgi:hypothetical protein
MLPITLLLALMLFMWAAAVWASWSDDDAGPRSSVGMGGRHVKAA